MNIVIGLALMGLGLYTLRGTKVFKLVLGIGLLYIGWQLVKGLVFAMGSQTVILF